MAAANTVYVVAISELTKMNVQSTISGLIKLTLTILLLISLYIAIETLQAENTGATIGFSKSVQFPSFTFCPLKYSYQDLEWIAENVSSNQTFFEKLSNTPSMIDAVVRIGFSKSIIYDDNLQP